MSFETCSGGAGQVAAYREYIDYHNTIEIQSTLAGDGDCW
jgi:hypothetical protein